MPLFSLLDSSLLYVNTNAINIMTSLCAVNHCTCRFSSFSVDASAGLRHTTHGYCALETQLGVQVIPPPSPSACGSSLIAGHSAGSTCNTASLALCLWVITVKESTEAMVVVAHVDKHRFERVGVHPTLIGGGGIVRVVHFTLVLLSILQHQNTHKISFYLKHQQIYT